MEEEADPRAQMPPDGTCMSPLQVSNLIIPKCFPSYSHGMLPLGDVTCNINKEHFKNVFRIWVYGEANFALHLTTEKKKKKLLWQGDISNFQKFNKIQ